MNTNDWGDKIAQAALRWNGAEFRPGVKEQCMNWVRFVLEAVKHPYAGRVTKEPVDGHWTGAALASSLAGRDLGQMIEKISDLEPGDVVFWNDTYSTGFPAGTITHVGIALSSEKFIHRNTMSAPVNVQPFAGIWARNFRCGMRVPQQIEADAEAKAPGPDSMPTSRTWTNQNGMVIEITEPIGRGRYQVFSAGGDKSGAHLQKWVPRT